MAQQACPGQEALEKMAARKEKPKPTGVLPKTSVVKAGSPTRQDRSFTVDYRLSLDELKGRGHFAWADEKIVRPSFAVSGSGTHELTGALLSFPGDVATADVLAAMEGSSLRPATLFELVSLVSAHADLPGEEPIGALGSANVNASGGPVCPAVSFFGGRELIPAWFDGPWLKGWRFLGMPREQQAGLGPIPHNHFLVPGPKLRGPKRFSFPPPAVRGATVSVDYSAALRALAKAAKIRNVSDSITDDAFPPGKGTRQLEMQVVHFNRNLSSGEIRGWLDRAGLRGADVRELACLAGAAPALMKELGAIGAVSEKGAFMAMPGEGNTLAKWEAAEVPGHRWEAWHSFAAVAK